MYQEHHRTSWRVPVAKSCTMIGSPEGSKSHESVRPHSRPQSSSLKSSATSDHGLVKADMGGVREKVRSSAVPHLAGLDVLGRTPRAGSGLARSNSLSKEFQSSSSSPSALVRVQAVEVRTHGST
eukprot:CAMPEP_0194520644 /NCGR_PEP_ID=MMETSP0253-20130528/54719_1 /TAXON_ID=2966 /ORGANISM="Noctiluca scintillans" /LENGTH=124 /DNA_ID=CAMNT_0039364913 /DNA_START=143 /DNA_END=518 /DNA_ORIENTATION=+